MDKFEKQPYEKFYISVNFADVLEEAEAISSAVCSAVDRTDAADSGVFDGEPVVDGTLVKIRVLAGEVAKSPYKITFRIVTWAGNQWEHDVQMKVREI
jgi:hypothetical protein